MTTRYVLPANRDDRASRQQEVAFTAASAGKLQRFEKAAETWKDVAAEQAGNQRALPVKLGAGDAELFRW